MTASSKLLNHSGELHWTTILLVVFKRVSNGLSDTDMHTCTCTYALSHTHTHVHTCTYLCTHTLSLSPISQSH